MTVTRDDRDIDRLTPSMDQAVLETIAARLEFRGTDEGYARRSQAYFARLPLRDARRILALGCGTGIEVRALRRLTRPEVAIVGVDHSPALIDAARRRTADEGLSGNVTYQVGDAHHLPYGDGEFDIVTLHTLISHVDDPPQVLREARRLVRPGGTVAVFDGDYASLTFAYPDHALAKAIEEKLIQLIVANPRIMRDLPRLLPGGGAGARRGRGDALRRDRRQPLLGRRHRVLRRAAGALGPAAPGGRRRLASLPGPIGRGQHLLRGFQLLHLPDAAAGIGRAVAPGW
jgi:ubiquinone/menaquinone biosynthesis C-methylase UbiE